MVLWMVIYFREECRCVSPGWFRWYVDSSILVPCCFRIPRRRYVSHRALSLGGQSQIIWRPVFRTGELDLANRQQGHNPMHRGNGEPRLWCNDALRTRPRFMSVHVTMMEREILKPIHAREEGSRTTPVNNFKKNSAAGTTRHGNG